MSWAWGPKLATVTVTGSATVKGTVALYRRQATVFVEAAPGAFCGRTVCAGWAAPVRLKATAASIVSLTVKSFSTNSGTVNVAFSNTLAVILNRGFPLLNTPESMSLDIDDPAKVWILGPAGDGVAFFGLLRR